MYSDVKNTEKYATDAGNMSLNRISSDIDLVFPKK